MNDLIGILTEKLTPAEIVELLKEYYPTQDEINEYAIENFVCPNCYGRLISKSLYEPNEHFGAKVKEGIVLLECEECGYVVD